MDIDKITELIISAAIKAHSKLGPGLLESVYKKALAIELKKLNLNFEIEKDIIVKYDGEDLGYTGEPFIWDTERRLILQSELDALYAHLYNITIDELDYILETFPIVKKKDIAKYGEYRTKRLILEKYEELKIF